MLKKTQGPLGDYPFLLTYGDDLDDVNLHSLITHHKKMGKTCTITSVQPEGRFGILEIDDNSLIKTFQEKFKMDQQWVYGL